MNYRLMMLFSRGKERWGVVTETGEMFILRNDRLECFSV